MRVPWSTAGADAGCAWPLTLPLSLPLHTLAQLRESVAAYEHLLTTAKGYRNALIALSSASTALAGALGECARVKGAGDSGENLMAASGLQYMVANSGQVLVSGALARAS